MTVLCAVSVTYGMYGPSDDVIELNPQNFHKKVMDDDALWLVEFYAPW